MGFVQRGGRGRGFGDRGGARGRGFSGGDRGGRGFGGGDRGRGFGDRGRGFGDRGGARGGGRGGFAPRGGFRGGANTGGGGARQTFDDSDDENTPQTTTGSSSFPKRAAAPGGAAPLATPGGAQKKAADGTELPFQSTKFTTVVSADGTELPVKMNNKVFIDGLPYFDPTDGTPSILDQLTHMVDQWRVGKVVHLTKKPGHSFGYLAFRSPQSVEVAVKVLNGKKFLGRPLKVQMPKPPKEIDPTKSYRLRPSVEESTVERQALMSDLPSSLAQAEVVREVIKQYSSDIEERIEMIKMAGNNRKAFITFVSALDVDHFIEMMNGKAVLGRRIAVQRAAAPGTLAYSKTPLGAAPVASRPAVAAAVEPVAAPTSTVAPASVIGANAKKAFPMPDLLSQSSTTTKLIASAAATPAVAATKQRAAVVAAPAAVSVTGSNLVYVGNIAEEVTADDLRRHFGRCGRILDCEVIVNPHTRESAGLAKISFALPAYAQKAKQELGGSLLLGQPVRVDREGDAPAPSGTADDDEDVEIESEPDEEAFAKERYGVSDMDAFLNESDSEDDDERPVARGNNNRKGGSQKQKGGQKQKAGGAGKKKLVAGNDKKGGKKGSTTTTVTAVGGKSLETAKKPAAGKPTRADKSGTGKKAAAGGKKSLHANTVAF